MSKPMRLPTAMVGSLMVLAATIGEVGLGTASATEPAPSTNTPFAASEAAKDPFFWLEEVQGEKALAWARERNATTLQRLKGDARFEPLRAEAEKFLTAKDRIAYGDLHGDSVHDFWQDQSHERGVWRKASLASYRAGAPQWEIVLDLDKLAKDEGENWVYKGRDCLEPERRRCMLRLSRGGSDAVVAREFDAVAKSFVKDGFTLPEGKQWLDWAGPDALMVATSFGAETMTDSGYPRQVRLWQRGADLAKAPILLNADKKDVWGRPTALNGPQGNALLLLRSPDFYTQAWSRLLPDGTVKKLALPLAIELNGLMGDDLIISLREDWTVGGRTHRRGAIVAVLLAEATAGAVKRVVPVFAPSETVAVQNLAIAQDKIYLDVMDNVAGRLLAASRDGKGGWRTVAIELPANGSINIVSTHAFQKDVLVSYNDFLQPDTLYMMPGGGKPEAIKSLPARFDAAPYTVEQRFALSKDGTQVPYFIVRAKTMPFNGDNPTLLYGYGGFEIAQTPSYFSAFGKNWLERGGVYVLANIRGGGEYGPRWHQAALKENRQRAYDDFQAIALDLFAQKITRPQRLGIQGGSNGGLLTGVTLTQKPELLGAAIVAVPLLDMMRYHVMLAGASWMGEYGNPEIPAERAWISRYSPYQNIRPDAAYPEAFIYTSTKDDRVHPGHARKFAARMEAMGHPALYYENIEGGHAAAANLKQRAEITALQLVYLMQKLMDQPKS
jgi:prolyl oligopeptidase